MIIHGHEYLYSFLLLSLNNMTLYFIHSFIFYKSHDNIIMDQEEKHPIQQCTQTMTFSSVLVGFIKENKEIFYLYVAFILCLPIKDVLVPHLVGKLYTCVKAGFKKGSTPCLWPLLLILVTIMIILQILGVLSDFVDHHVFPAIQSYVRFLMMRHQFAQIRGNGDIETGMLLSHMFKLPSMYYSLLETFKGSLVPGSVTLTVCIAYIWWVAGPLVGLVLSATLIVPMLVAYLTFDRCVSRSLARDQVHSQIYAKIDDVISNINTVVVTGSQETELGRINVDQHFYKKHSIDMVKCSLYVKYVAVPLILLFIIFLCYRAYTTSIPEGKVVSLLIVCFVIFSTIMGLTETYKSVIMKWGSVKNSLTVFTNCEARRVLEEDGRSIQPQPQPNHLDFINVTYYYPNGKMVFNHKNLSIELGKTTIIRGQIGVGKSTFISLLLKTQVPQGGEIWWDGVPYSSLETRDIRSRIFFVPQNPKLLNRTLYENITYGLPNPKPSKADVLDLVTRLDLNTSFHNILPQGLETPVGVGGSKLSGGQRQITVLIKLFLSDPEIVLLDEPTSSLDEETKELVMNLIVEAIKGRTVIAVTHDPFLLQYADAHLQF